MSVPSSSSSSSSSFLLLRHDPISLPFFFFQRHQSLLSPHGLRAPQPPDHPPPAPPIRDLKFSRPSVVFETSVDRSASLLMASSHHATLPPTAAKASKDPEKDTGDNPTFIPLGVGEHISIIVEVPRECVPRTTIGVGDNITRTEAPPIQVMIHRLSPTDVTSSSAVDNLKPDTPVATDNSQLSTQDELKAELQGVFNILSLLVATVIAISLMVYKLVPEGDYSTHRVAWLSFGVVVSLALMGATIAQLGTTERALETSASCGIVTSTVVIVIFEMVLVGLLPGETWSMILGSVICVCLVICNIYAWTECAGRPKCLRGSIRRCCSWCSAIPGCCLKILMGCIHYIDRCLLCSGRDVRSERQRALLLHEH